MKIRITVFTYLAIKVISSASAEQAISFEELEVLRKNPDISRTVYAKPMDWVARSNNPEKERATANAEGRECTSYEDPIRAGQFIAEGCVSESMMEKGVSEGIVFGEMTGRPLVLEQEEKGALERKEVQEKGQR